MNRACRWFVLATAICGSAVLLHGCATQGQGQQAPGGGTKDRVTASDETDVAKRARVRMELATAYFSRGQFTTALDEVKMALTVQPNMGDAYNLRGLIYGALGDDQLTQESFQRALQINPRDGDAMHNYGWYQCQQRRYAEAEQLFQQAVASPDYLNAPRTMLTSGICQARAGRWTEAEATLNKAYERDPANPAIAVNLSEVLLRRGEYERARFYMRRVNAVPDYQSAQTFWLAARIEMKLGNRQGAYDYGAQLRSRFPQSRESGAFDRGQFDE
jgi:type IV pilus assembly protein PilF